MPPRTQAALLECMEEHQVTIDGTRYPLSTFFTVFATQNPIEFEGTYPLARGPAGPISAEDSTCLIRSAQNEVRLLSNVQDGFESRELRPHEFGSCSIPSCCDRRS